MRPTWFRWAYVLAFANLALAIALIVSGNKSLHEYQASLRADMGGRQMPVWEHIPREIQLMNAINFPAVVASYPLRYYAMARSVQTTGYLICVSLLWLAVGSGLDKHSVAARGSKSHVTTSLALHAAVFAASVAVGFLTLTSVLTGHELITKLGAIVWAVALTWWSISKLRLDLFSRSSDTI